jgi:Leucine-rich repeat (LRR) protein
MLDQNQLRTLPEEVGYLPRLESLIVCDNPLKSLPESVVYLRSLKALDVSNTLIPAAEVEELRRRLPGVDVRFRQDG